MEQKEAGRICLLSVEEVRKSFRRKRVLQGGRLRAHAGEVVGIVGENGSGKTTLLKIIAGLLAPDAGRVHRAGLLGYCPQQSLLYPYLTVEEHFRLFGRAYRLPPADASRRSAELMHLFGFTEYRRFKVHQLSGGTQQKLNLSLALLHDPDLLLLDEPYAGFDWETYQRFLEFTRQAREQGKCVVMVSHLVHDRRDFDVIYELRNGVLCETKP